MLPKVHKFILSYVPIISARTLFEDKLPNSMNVWKEKVFLSLWEDKNYKLEKDILTNLIVVGDSYYEMEAGISF